MAPTAPPGIASTVPVPTAAQAARAPARAAAAPGFSAEIATDPDTGWHVPVLRFRHPNDAARSLEARVAPDAGANLFSLRLGDDRVLAEPEHVADLKLHKSGTPVMFPMPNRVRDATFTWRGRKFSFEPNSGPNLLHGLARNRPWRLGCPAVDRTGAEVDLVLDWDERQPDFARFPIRHRLTVVYRLVKDGIRISYAAENRSPEPFPFGFGLHPFFPVVGRRADILLWSPAPKRMEAVDNLPTGRLIPVAGTPYDLRRPRVLDELDLDDVFCGITPAMRPGFEWRDRGIRVTFAASRDFGHLVVFTPRSRPVLCIENQTCSTDAHNLHALGLRRLARLLVAPPGKTLAGWNQWKVERVRRARA